jgi:outer membrane protein assembly factor BamB
MKKWIAIGALSLSVGILPTFAQEAPITLSDPSIGAESVEFNPASGTFLVGSTANGTIYEVSMDGTVTPFIEDESLTGTVGLHIDSATNRLLVVNASGITAIAGLADGIPDPSQLQGAGGPGNIPTPDANGMIQVPEGVQLPPFFPTPDANGMVQVPPQFLEILQQGGPGAPGAGGDFGIRLLAFDLTTQEKVLDVDLTGVSGQQGPKLANDVTTDAQGNAYVTDSLGAVVYYVDPAGNVAFLTSDQFAAQGLGVNGISHSDGVLIVGLTQAGTLLRVPLDNPQNVSAVTLAESLVGVDGILFREDGKLLAVSNSEGKLYLLSSTDGWVSATVEATADVPVGATSVTLDAAGNPYVLSGGLPLAARAEAPTAAIQAVSF